jgi:hypothetical protein
MPHENPTGAPESPDTPSHNNNTQTPNGSTADPTSSSEELTENSDGKDRLRNSGIFLGVLGGIVVICIAVPVSIKAWRTEKPPVQIVNAGTPDQSEEDGQDGSFVETFPPPPLSELTGPSNFSVATSSAISPALTDTLDPNPHHIPTCNDQVSSSPTPLTEVETGAPSPCSLLTLDSGGHNSAQPNNDFHDAALPLPSPSHNATFLPSYKDQARTVLAFSNVPSPNAPSPSRRNSNSLNRSGNENDQTADDEDDIPFAVAVEVDTESTVSVPRHGSRQLEP